MLEMKEAAYICENITPRSLVLVDELGRATSNEDGVAIAWAVAEHLLLSRSITFFVTHYEGLNGLEKLYENVVCMSFGKCTVDKGSAEVGSETRTLLYDHKRVTESCKVASNYGIDMAKVCGWQEEVVEKAHLIRGYIVDKIGGDGGVKLDIRSGERGAEIREKLAKVKRSLGVLVQKGGKELSVDARRDFLALVFSKVEGDGGGAKISLEYLRAFTERGEEGAE